MTGDEKNQFRTVRVDSDDPLDNVTLAAEFGDILEAFRRRYETQVRFAPPSSQQTLPDYQPPLPGELNWEWGDEEYEEF